MEVRLREPPRSNEGSSHGLLGLREQCGGDDRRGPGGHDGVDVDGSEYGAAFENADITALTQLLRDEIGRDEVDAAAAAEVRYLRRSGVGDLLFAAFSVIVRWKSWAVGRADAHFFVH